MQQLNLTTRVGLFLAAGTVFSAATLAQPVATVSNFVYTGNGCPAGSAKATIINGGKTLRVEFQAFKVSMNGTKGTPVAECEISAFLTPPAKQKLEISPAEYIGAYSARAQIALNAGHYWAKKWAGPWAGGTAGTATGAAGVYRFNNPNKTQYGVCGGKDELKDDGAKGIKLSIKPGDMVSADLKVVDYTLNYAPCEGSGGGGTGTAG